MVPAVAFVGYHNSGKTSFATKVVEILTRRGYRVGVLKSTKHRGLIKDVPGTDTYRYKEAGALRVGLAEPERLTVMGEYTVKEPSYLAFTHFGDCDVVICEGFKSSNLPKFEVVREELKEKMLGRELKNLIGVVADFEVEGVKTFPIDKPEKVADFIEERFIKGGPKAVMFINGKEVPMNRFVQESLKGVIKGFISALKGIDEPLKRVEIRIDVEKE